MCSVFLFTTMHATIGCAADMRSCNTGVASQRISRTSSAVKTASRKGNRQPHSSIWSSDSTPSSSISRRLATMLPNCQEGTTRGLRTGKGLAEQWRLVCILVTLQSLVWERPRGYSAGSSALPESTVRLKSEDDMRGSQVDEVEVQWKRS